MKTQECLSLVQITVRMKNKTRILLLSSFLSFLTFAVMSGQTQSDPEAQALVDAIAHKDAKAIQSLWRLTAKDCPPILEALSEKAEQDPDNSEWPYYQAIVCEQAAQTEDALHFYLRSDSLRPSDSVKQRIAACYDALSRWEEAISVFTPSVESDPDNESKILTLARYHYEKGDLTHVIEQLSAFQTRHPDASASLYLARGDCYLAAGQEAEADADYARALQSDPNQTEVLLAIVQTLLRKGEEKSARKLARHALEMPNRNTRLEPLLLAYSEMPDVAEESVRSQLLKATLAGKKTGDAHYTLAQVCALSGKRAKACFHLGEAFKNGYNHFFRTLQDPALAAIRGEDWFMEDLRAYWPESLSSLAPFKPEPEGEKLRPQFQGGDPNTFSQWVNSQLKYPLTCRKDGIQGIVSVSFYIDPDGKLTDPEVVINAHPDLDKEALRVIRSSPLWTPGTVNGNPVRVHYLFPVYFVLRN